MENKKIILAGVGGQGLVLTTQIMAEAAFNAGFDVKTNDVIGLSQRGGKIWGSVKYGDKVYSPNIAPGEGDILIAFESMEGRRWRHMMKPGALFIVNEYEIAPALVQQEKEPYSEDIAAKLEDIGKLVQINATNLAKELGNTAAANIILLGRAARDLDIPVEMWYKSIEKNVPPKFKELNIKAFDLGYNMSI